MKYNYQKLAYTLRNKLVMSQEEFAKYLGVLFVSINRWEKGHHEPTIKIKKKIIELCKENNIELELENE